jgi:hypothetical protein
VRRPGAGGARVAHGRRLSVGDIHTSDLGYQKLADVVLAASAY